MPILRILTGVIIVSLVSGALAQTKPATMPAKPARTQWQVDQAVEVKWGGSWRTAKINNKRAGDWYLVTYEPGRTQEWVEWYRIRKVGATDDIPGHARPNGFYKKGENPPRADAGDHPADAAAAKKAAAEEAQQAKAAVGAPDRGAKPPEPDQNPKPRPQPAQKDDAIAFDKPAVQADLSRLKEIELPAKPTWDVAADPSQLPALTDKPIPIKTSHKLSQRQAHLSAGATLAVVGKGVNHTVEVVDLATGRTSPVVMLSPECRPIAISPSGKRLLTVHEFRSVNTGTRLDLWTLDGAGGATHVVGFVPYPGKKSSGGSRIHDAVFVNEDIVYTTGMGTPLVAWDIAGAKANWSFQVWREKSLSPGRKYLLASNRSLTALDAVTGKVVGHLQPSVPIGSFGVTAGGDRLITGGGSSVAIFEFTSGKHVDGFNLDNRGPVMALAGEAAVVGPYLLDLGKRQWTYDYRQPLDESIARVGDRIYGMGGTNEAPLVISAQLPHPAARKATDSARPAEVIVQDGMKVALDVQIIAKPEQVDEVTKAVTANLAQRKITIDPAAPVRIVLKTSEGQPRQVTVQDRAGKLAPQTVTVTPRISTYSVQVDGKTFWESNRTFEATESLWVEPGQTAQQAVDANQNYVLAHFGKVQLPLRVTKSDTDLSKLPKAKWGRTGLED